MSIRDESVGSERFIAFGYSSTAVLVCVLTFVSFILVPIATALPRLPGNTTVVGSESLAISAACHVSVLSMAAHGDSDENGSRQDLNRSDIGRVDDMSDHIDAEAGGYQVDGHVRLLAHEARISHSFPSTTSTDDQRRLALSRGRIKWGEVQMPPEWYRQYDGLPEPIRHLSFGVEGDDVQEPEEGQWYA